MRLKALLLSTSILCTVAPAGNIAFAQQRAPDNATRLRARQNFQTGVAAFTRGDYSVALEAFQTAYRLAPNPVVRVNIANCYMQMHQPVEALTYFEAFLAESPNAAPAQRADVQHQIDELRRQVAEVHVGVSPDTVRDPVVSVDGHATAIRNVVRMMPGRHVIEASADGYATERQEVDATPGMQRELVLRMRTYAEAAAAANAVASTNTARTTPPTTAAATTTTTTTTNTRPVETPVTTTHPETATATTTTASTTTSNSTPTPTQTAGGDDLVHVRHDQDQGARRLSPVFFYSGVGLTGAALICWASFGIAALVNNGTYENARTQIQAGNNVFDQQNIGYGAMQNANTFALASDISLAVTGAAAIATVILFTQTRFDNSRPTVSVAPMGGHGVGGIMLGGRF